MQEVQAVLAVDFDDTIAQSNEAVIAWHNQAYGTSHDVGPESYDLSVLWNVHREEVERRFMEYVDSMMHDRVRPMPHAVEALAALSRTYDIHMVTGRLEGTEIRTRVWVNAVMSGIFSDLHFTSHFAQDPARRRKKSSVCQRIGARFFVEDSAAMAAEVADNASDTTVFLLDSIWNQGFMHPRVTRVRSWREILDVLK